MRNYMLELRLLYANKVQKFIIKSLYVDILLDLKRRRSYRRWRKSRADAQLLRVVIALCIAADGRGLWYNRPVKIHLKRKT